MNHPLAAARARLWPLAVTALALAAGAWAVFSVWRDVLAVGADVTAAWRVLPAIVPLHLLQLLLSAQAWRLLFRPADGAAAALGLLPLFRLRVVREGVDSLLPVAQVGGEMVAVHWLARQGVDPGRAGASVIVDLTIEVVSQFVFLLAGLAVLALLSPESGGGTLWARWLALAAVGGGAGTALLLVQRFGALRLLERLLARVAERFPGLVGPVAGLHEATLALYGRPAALSGAGAVHLLAWSLGTVEAWLVLHALGSAATPWQALAVESLGMAARSAGFAVPGALVVQEAGFILAAVAVGLPPGLGLGLSVVKRVREILVGLGGLALWRFGPARRRP